jgi:hypothetical protein
MGGINMSRMYNLFGLLFFAGGAISRIMGSSQWAISFSVVAVILLIMSSLLRALEDIKDAIEKTPARVTGQHERGQEKN